MLIEMLNEALIKMPFEVLIKMLIDDLIKFARVASDADTSDALTGFRFCQKSCILTIECIDGLTVLSEGCT